MSKEAEGVQESIEFTRKEFGKHSLEDQAKMYGAFCIFACMKWPEHADKFVTAYDDAWCGGRILANKRILLREGNNKKEADNVQATCTTRSPTPGPEVDGRTGGTSDVRD